MTILEKIQTVISATKNPATISGLKYFANKLKSHRYGVDLGDLPYNALECEYVKGKLMFVINIGKIPADFEVLAQIDYTDGYQEMFTKSIDVLEYEKSIREKGDVTLEIAKLVSGKQVIVPAKEFNDIMNFYWLLFNSKIEPYGQLSNFLLRNLRIENRINIRKNRR